MSNKEEQIETHPSFGQASFSRVSGNTNLFGSEFNHQHYMILTISHCERHRDLSRDWYFSRNEIIRIALSEAQFVELITSPNMGMGVPVTIQHIDHETVEDPPVREDMKSRYEKEFKADAKRCVEELDAARKELEAAIESGKVGKAALREISKKIEYAALAVSSGIPFVEHQFREAMESTMAHARVEIESHVSAMAMRIGVEQMRLDAVASAPKLIEEKSAGGFSDQEKESI